jgi:type II secretory pathway pseudopilin PulG
LIAPQSNEDGDTLVEVLIAVVIMGLTVSALLGALIVSITSSAEHRSLADLDTVLKSNAENVKNLIQIQPPANAMFADCAVVTGTTYSPPTGPTSSPFTFSAPTGYSIRISGISYWDSATNQFDAVSSTACQANPNDQTGFQLLTFSATAPNGVSQTLSVGVRAPA